MTPGAEPSKQALRAEARERRRIMTSDERERSEAGFFSHLKQLVTDENATTISCYLSTIDEPSTREFIEWATGAGITVLLPISREDGLMDWAKHDGSEIPDFLGMPSPASQVVEPMAIHDADLLIIPAALVSTTGVRLGWGRGYFDRTLGSMENRPPVFAVVYDFEVVDSLPTEAHDQNVDGAITPSGVIRFASN